MKLDRYQEFNEKLGISTDMELQVDNFMKEIKSNPNSLSFQLEYTNELGTFPFTLIIDKKIPYDGSADIVSRTNYKYIIKLKDRNDIQTLLHEIKHMDYSIRNKENELNNSYNSNRAILKAHPNKGDKIKILAYIFYIYSDDEFQSQYQSIYKSFDIYFKDRVKDMNTKDITYNFIHEEFKSFIEREFKLIYAFYSMKIKFNFNIFCTEKLINKLFLYIINNKKININFENGNPYKGIFSAIRYSFESVIRNVFNTYSKEQKLEIAKTRKFFENDITRKNKVYSRKILRIIPLIYDKYH